MELVDVFRGEMGRLGIEVNRIGTVDVLDDGAIVAKGWQLTGYTLVRIGPERAAKAVVYACLRAVERAADVSTRGSYVN